MDHITDTDLQVDVDALRASLLRFPSADLMQAARGQWFKTWQPGAPVGKGLLPGPRSEVVAGPGMVQVRYRTPESWDRAREAARRPGDLAYQDRAARLEAARHAPMGLGESHDDIFARPVEIRRRSKIRAWSRKSRARLVYQILSLDLAGFVGDAAPVMATLTLPGDWRAVCDSPEDAYRLYDTFRKRFERRWGIKARWIWKKEFQRRGAPHWHLWLTCPTEDRREFLDWLSAEWADVVGASTVQDRGLEHVDGGCACSERCRHRLAGTNVSWADGLKAADPKRLAVYFLKESLGGEAKAYQNQAPEHWETTGRFWGTTGIETARVAVEVTPAIATAMWRAMRKIRKQRGGTIRVRVPRVNMTTGEVTYRNVRRRPRTDRRAGWIAVHDGAALFADLARWAELAPF